MKKFYPFVFLLLTTGNHFAQDNSNPVVAFKENAAVHSEIQNQSLLKEIVTNTNTDKWASAVRPTFSRNHLLPEVHIIKEAKINERLEAKPEKEIEAKSTATPVLGSNFEANWSTVGIPPDNTMAISNGGSIVSANNDGILYYNTSGNLLYADFWSDFFNDPTLNGQLYDPKVIYDVGADRFVLVVLHGTNSSNSKVVVSFSKTNNPNDGWWTYAFSGNPLNDGSWFDYPNMGVTTQELVVTGNLFTNSNNFNEAIVYQMDKTQGYAGANINFSVWSQLDNTVFNAFTLVPASSGNGTNVGPGIHFVSNAASGNNKIKLWTLTNTLSANPQLNQTVINTTFYSPAADANQQGTAQTLSNGDNRIQSAFFLDGIVHFVFHSDVGSGWNGINYNRLNVATSINTSSTFGSPGNFDNSYPTVASFTNVSNNKSVMIGYLSASPNKFAEVRVVNCDNAMNWSTSTLVKAGEAFIDVLSGNERWGDYSGISRRHNSSTPKIWLAGCYGANIPQASVSNSYKTWIAEISGTDPTGLEEQELDDKFVVYPVPTYDFMNINFTIETQEEVVIEIVDINGKSVKTLFRGVAKVGENKLTFNKDALPAGTYFVSISTNTKTLKNEKIIILD
jgi:uncharacterized protein YifN (PemK superfamily)